MSKGSKCQYCTAPKRHPGCHSTCEDYLEWKRKDQEEKQVIREGKGVERGFQTYYRKLKTKLNKQR